MLSKMTHGAVWAIVAAAVVALSGFPAQAQPHYYNDYGPRRYYGAACQTYSYGGMIYTNCPQPAPYYTYYY